MKIVHQQVQDDPERRRRVAILGFGREGKSVLKFLKNSPTYKNSDIYICDKNPNLEIPKGLKAILGKNYLKNLIGFDIVFRTPGIPYGSPKIQKAIKNGVKFSSATQLFFNEIRKMVRRGSPQVIGVTGTKGKGTTSTILYKILKSCGKKVLLAGNIGTSALDVLPKIKKNSIVILELSSFQLQDLKSSPDISAVLNIFPDHMDSHKSFSEYITSKTNIAKFQSPNAKVFYDTNNKYSVAIAQKSKAKKMPVNWREFKYDIKMPGEHSIKNAAMAAAIAASLGCPKEKIAKIVKNFPGNEHRLEFVRKIMVRQAHHKKTSIINFYNDSASTNPQTTIAAIKAFKESKILIVGGKDKGLNYTPLTKTLKGSNTKLVILFGENKNKIKKQIAKSKMRIVFVKNLTAAVQLAYKTAKSLITQLPNSPITIIFSPAAASFDMFKDYADRGNQFKQLVKQLK